MKVYIDPGHGGTANPGAVGPSGRREKTLNLQIAELLELACKRSGWFTIFSRRRDTWVHNGARARHANQWGADLYVSVHCNGIDNPAVQGHEVLHWHSSVRPGDEHATIAMRCTTTS